MTRFPRNVHTAVSALLGPRDSPVQALPRAAVALAAVLLAGCVTTNVAPLTAAEAEYGAYEDERELIRRAETAHAEFKRRGMVFEDSELQQYIEHVASGLIPPATSKGLSFRFRVLRVPTINAFAAANGDIYVHEGLLAHLENEAQLAHVLAHEISHTLKRHQLIGLRNYQNKTVFAKIAGIGLSAVDGGGLGAVLLGLSHVAAVSGYARSLEEEADLEGLKLMAAAGYASNEAPRTYRRLNEIEEPGAVEGFFYSNHPSNSARAEYTERMINSGVVPRNADGRIAAEEFTAAIRNDVFDNIRLRLRAHHYEFALQEVDHALTRYGDDPLLHTYRGDANRRIAEDPRGAAREEAARERREVTRERVESFEAQTSERLRAALAAYRDALELDPSLAIAHRGMGLAAYRTGDHATAAQELQLYLDTESAPFDRRYVEQILEEISP